MVETARLHLPKTMPAALVRGLRDVAVAELPVPEVGPGEVLVEVSHCGICGSDLHYILEWGPMRPDALEGHEWSGTAVAVGPGGDRWGVSDTVVGGPIDCSGSARAMEAALGLLVRGGTLVLVGSGIRRPRFDPNHILLNELVVTGANTYDADVLRVRRRGAEREQGERTELSGRYRGAPQAPRAERQATRGRPRQQPWKGRSVGAPSDPGCSSRAGTCPPREPQVRRHPDPGPVFSSSRSGSDDPIRPRGWSRERSADRSGGPSRARRRRSPLACFS